MSEGEQTLALAEHYLELDQPQRALEALDRAHGLLDDPVYWRLRAAALVDADRHRDGIAAAERGLRLDPEDIALLLVHALAESGTGDIAAAERSLLSALSLNPESPLLLAEYALLVARAGQLDKATRLLDKAERVDPLDRHVVTARGIVAYLRGDDTATVAHAEELLADDPEASAGHLLRASVLAGRGSARAARRHLETAARIDPANATIVDAARNVRVMAHPILWPMYPVIRFGPMKVWLAFLALAGLAYLTHVTAIVAVVIVAYLFLVLYSWIVPPLFKLYRRSRGAR